MGKQQQTVLGSVQRDRVSARSVEIVDVFAFSGSSPYSVPSKRSLIPGRLSIKSRTRAAVTKLIYAVITLALIPACAQIERPKIVLTSTSHAPQVAPLKPVPFPIYHPAIEFDHPYKGELTIVTAQSAEDLQKACRNYRPLLGVPNDGPTDARLP